MSMGERAPVALLDFHPARLAVAESVQYCQRIVAILNVSNYRQTGCPLTGHEGEDAGLYAAVKAVGEELCPALGATIPVGELYVNENCLVK